MKNFLLALSFLILVSLGCKQTANLETSNAPSSNSTAARNSPPENTKPIFNAADLAGKNEAQVNKIFGKPVDADCSTRDPKKRICEYSVGEMTLVEFHQNRIESLVVFFEGGDVDKATAYQRVGLKTVGQAPVGIDRITTNQNWIKIFYK